MSRDTLATPLPPLVAFGDTARIPHHTLPREFHVLFECPLSLFLAAWITYC